MKPKCSLTSLASGRGAPFEKTDAPTRKASPKALLLAGHVGAALGLLVALASQPVRAAVIEAWVQRYSNMLSNSYGQSLKVVRDAAGGIIVTGTADDGINGQDML